MPDEKLVLVERFEDLRTGMRVAIRPCIVPGCRSHVGIVGPEFIGISLLPSGRTAGPGPLRRVVGATHGNGKFISVSIRTVFSRALFRFASDLGIDDQIASEENPYLSRSVVGTGGVDEVRVPAKERP